MHVAKQAAQYANNRFRRRPLTSDPMHESMHTTATRHAPTHSRPKLPGAAARHPTDHPEARFRALAYLPNRPDRLAPRDATARAARASKDAFDLLVNAKNYL